MRELTPEMIVDEHARAALERLKARVARRPGRWRRRMTRAVVPLATGVRRGLALAA